MTDNLDGIAIIGMSGRFPGAEHLDGFWQNLKDGHNAIQPIPDEKLNLTPEERQTLLNDPNFVQMGSYVEDSDKFDAAFFGIYPKEAQAMDPQHRLLLECSWEAFEDAGYNPDTTEGMVGVYAGCYMNTYMLSSLESNPAFIGSLANSFHGGVLQNELGNDKDYLATRISFKLNLRGPSLTIQTACSTSLVAIIQACLSLSAYQCDMALAGGATLKFPQNRGYLYEQDGMVAPDGKCRTFDANARGTVFGDGVGMVLLKRLEDALEDEDQIYAVIRGWGINNDGASKVGYTAPSVEGQSEAIALAQAYAGFDASTITYVEAHGTGTPLGDPIEIDALTKAFRETTDKNQFCAIGSLKTNLGHLDIAAGVAGLIKTALSLKHKQIPASLHFETPNPNIDFPNTPFYVNTALKDWPEGSTPRRAGLSSFGVGGTNAHVVLEEAPDHAPAKDPQSAYLLRVSARSETALDEATRNLADYLERHPERSLADASYTLAMGRRTFNYSRTIVARSQEEAISLLRDPSNTNVSTVHQVRRGLPVVFMFPGQGAQHVNMGKDLYESSPVFKENLDTCADLLQPILHEDIRTILYPAPGQENASTERLKSTEIAQPAIFAISYSLAKYWMHYGLQPKCMIGHSVGEFVAACLAGVFNLEEALKAVATRGRLMQDMPTGSMLSVRLSKTEVETLLTEELAIAAVNSPELCVISGPDEAIEALAKALESEDIPCRHLHTSHAFHSAMMDAAVPLFEEHLAELKLQPPSQPVLSTVSASWLEAEQATDTSYWARHLRETVQFADGMSELLTEEACIFLEVGPGQTLSTLTRQHKQKNENHRVLSSMPHAKMETSSFVFALKTLGQLWQHGAEVAWEELFKYGSYRRKSLPTYPFERKRFWYENLMQTGGTSTVNGQHLNGNGNANQSSVSPPVNNDYTIGEDVQQLLLNQLQVMTQQLMAWNTSAPKKSED